MLTTTAKFEYRRKSRGVKMFLKNFWKTILKSILGNPTSGAGKLAFYQTRTLNILTYLEMILLLKMEALFYMVNQEGKPISSPW